MPLKLFAINRERLCKQFKEEQCPKGAVVVLQSGEQKQRNCTDTDEVFRQVCICVCLSVCLYICLFVHTFTHVYYFVIVNIIQESYFHWTFGVREPDCYGALEVDTGKVMLFFPRLPPEYVVWMGTIHSLDHFKNKYQVDRVHYIDEVCVLYCVGFDYGFYFICYR